jgi:hypothetical protein
VALATGKIAWIHRADITPARSGGALAYDALVKSVLTGTDYDAASDTIKSTITALTKTVTEQVPTGITQAQADQERDAAVTAERIRIRKLLGLG